MAGSSSKMTITSGDLPPYEEARPPRMVGTQFPPSKSDSKVVSEYLIEDIDKVIDPSYPWQGMSHQTPEGKRRREECKQKKHDNVAGYVIQRSQRWQQFRVPLMKAFSTEVTSTYRIGVTRKIGTTIEAGIELSLGLDEGAFSAEAKGHLNFTKGVEEIFDYEKTESEKYTILAGYWYIFWQTYYTLTLYRKEKNAPQNLVKVTDFDAATPLLYTDAVVIQDYPREVGLFCLTPISTLKPVDVSGISSVTE